VLPIAPPANGLTIIADIGIRLRPSCRSRMEPRLAGYILPAGIPTKLSGGAGFFPRGFGALDQLRLVGLDALCGLAQKHFEVGG
jgi:hypothetical protein